MTVVRRWEDPAAGAGRGSPRLLAGAVCWILGLEWFVGQAIAQAAWTTPYSLASDYISDLGAVTCGRPQIAGYHVYVCSPLHTVMNVAFALLGLLTLAGVVLLRPTLPRGRLASVGVAFVALFGVGKIVVGLDPEDVRLLLHSLGALGILCGNIGVLLLGLAYWRIVRWRAAISLLVGVVGIVSFLLLAGGPSANVGIIERLADYPLPVWMAVLGAITLVRGMVRRRRLAGEEPSPAS